MKYDLKSHNYIEIEESQQLSSIRKIETLNKKDKFLISSNGENIEVISENIFENTRYLQESENLVESKKITINFLDRENTKLEFIQDAYNNTDPMPEDVLIFIKRLKEEANLLKIGLNYESHSNSYENIPYHFDDKDCDLFKDDFTILENEKELFKKFIPLVKEIIKPKDLKSESEIFTFSETIDKISSLLNPTEEKYYQTLEKLKEEYKDLCALSMDDGCIHYRLNQIEKIAQDITGNSEKWVLSSR